MIYDFNRAECPDPAHSDVCLLGAGAAGIALAVQMASAGFRVTVLEGGGRFLEGRSQDIYRSENAGLPHAGVNTGRFRTLGGSTTEWGGQMLELDEEDFRSREWVPGSGWPFPKSALRAEYARALDFAGLRRAESDDQAIWAALRKQPPDLSPELYMAFSRWCPERDFAKLHWPMLSASRKIAVFCHANATGFVLNEGRTAILATRISSFSNRRATVKADYFVLCMGGIESTRFLLQPAMNGLLPWQTNGIVGRYFQDHVCCNGIRLRSLRTQPAHKWFGHVSSQGFTYHNKVRLAAAQQAAHRTLNVTGTINLFTKQNEKRDLAFQALRRAWKGGSEISFADSIRTALYLPSIVRAGLSRRLRKEPPPWKKIMLSVHTEQSPLSSSTITLSGERDELGMLRTQLDWRISDAEIHTIRTYVKICESVFRRHAFASLDVPAGFYEDDHELRRMCVDSNHHMGSTRMSISAEHGVVNPDLRLHGIANGYVCSSSVFPSSGFSNPTHTLLALAMRLSSLLVAKLADKSVAC